MYEITTIDTGWGIGVDSGHVPERLRACGIRDDLGDRPFAPPDIDLAADRLPVIADVRAPVEEQQRPRRDHAQRMTADACPARSQCG